MSVRLGPQWCERNGVLPTSQFAYWKGLGTFDALLCVSHTLQNALGSGQEARTCRLISVQPLIGLTISAFSIGSALCVLEVCVVYTDTVFVKPMTPRYGGWL